MCADRRRRLRLILIHMCGGPQAPVDWWEHSRSVDLNQLSAEPIASASASPSKVSVLPRHQGQRPHHTRELQFQTAPRDFPSPNLWHWGIMNLRRRHWNSRNLCLCWSYVFTRQRSAPTPTVRLIPVLKLNRSGRYTSRSDKDCFWLTNRNGATTLRDSVHENRRLCCLSMPNARTAHTRPASPAANVSISPQWMPNKNHPMTAR